MITIAVDSSAKWDMFGLLKTKVSKIFFEICETVECLGKEHIIITSMIRPKKNDSGVHELARAIDFVIPYLNDNEINSILDAVNTNYVYDIKRPEKKTLIYHSTDSYNASGYHFHLQVM